MQPLDVTQIILREFVKKLDIAGQAHPNMSAFDQIMAQQQLLGKPSRKHAVEGANVIDAFAVIGPFAGQILVDVGNRAGIGVDADGIRKEPAERRTGRAGQGRAHARLDDGVTGPNAPGAVETRPVQGMRQRLDHPAGGVVRQLRVAVQGDDESDVG